MKKNLIVIIIFLTYSCSDDSIKVTYYPSGSLETRIVKKNSNIYYFEEFYDNNRIKTTGFIENGELNGSVISYNENGEIEKVYNYKNGEIDGLQKTYDSNGQIYEYLYYLKGDMYYFQTFMNNKNAGEHVIPIITRKNQTNDNDIFDISIPFNDSLDYYNNNIDVYYKFSNDSTKWGDDKEDGVFRFNKLQNEFEIEYDKRSNDYYFIKTLSILNNSKALGYLKVKRMKED